eukprot:364873-Chlamydomonas_euryale.AAC.8
MTGRGQRNRTGSRTGLDCKAQGSCVCAPPGKHRATCMRPRRCSAEHLRRVHACVRMGALACTCCEARLCNALTWVRRGAKHAHAPQQGCACACMDAPGGKACTRCEHPATAQDRPADGLTHMCASPPYPSPCA